jgi:hypothetical protein
MHPCANVGDASGVQYSAGVPPDDNKIASGDACASQVLWHSYAIVGDASGVPDDNETTHEDTYETQIHWYPYCVCFA